MKDTDYTYAVARVRCNEAALLSPAEIERCVTAKSLREVVALLTDKGLCEQDAPAAAAADGLLQRAWALVDEVNPAPQSLDFLRVGNDFHNLKAVLKGVVTDRPYEPLCIYPAITPSAQLAEAISEQRFERLPDYMSTAAAEAYDAFVSSADGQLSDLLLDRAAMDAMIQLATATGDEFLRGLGVLNAAMRNLRIAARGARLGLSEQLIGESLCSSPALPLGAPGMAQAAAEGVEPLADYLTAAGAADAAEQLRLGIAQLERYCDDAPMQYIQKVRYSSFGAGVLAAFIVRAGMQQRNLRIILTGKAAGLDEADIRRRLRRAD